MGAGGSTEIFVNFHNSNFFYYGGDRVFGTIDFHNNHDKLRIGQIFLEFTGELGYISKETRPTANENSRSRTEQEVRHNQIVFLSSHIPVVRPQNGQNEMTLYRGQHSWPFEFNLPESLPPSTVSTATVYPYIKYYVNVLIDKPWFKPSAKNVYQLIIFPRVNVFNTVHNQHSLAFSNTNRKKLSVEGSLLQGAVVPGQKMGLYLHLTNPKRSEIKRVKANFIQYRQIGLNQQSEVIFSMDLPGLTEYSGMEFQRTYEIQIPLNFLAPTYTYTPVISTHNLPITYHYELQLEFKSRGLFTDFRIIVPVVVATDPAIDHQLLANTFTETLTPTAPPYEPDELPPSYDSIVANGKI